jgi:RNA polymerase sigma-70 factor (ECF subfamily)
VLRRLRLHTVESPAAPAETIDDVLDVLDADRRDAFVLTQLVGLPYEEAAAALGCPVGTIRSRVSRARAQLLAALDEAAHG